MSQERDVIPLILTGLGTIVVTVLTLWYYGYVHFAKEEDALLLADFTMLKSIPGFSVIRKGGTDGDPVFRGMSGSRLGILLDASHASDATTEQMIELSSAPIILSHSGAKAIYTHPRNAPDDLLRKLAAKGGVIQINAFSGYMKDMPEIPERKAALAELFKTYGQPRDIPADKREAYRAARNAIEAKYPIARANMDDLMKHIQRAAQVAGKAHVGVSGDFDGGGGIEGFDDITYFPALTERLIAAGWSKDDLAGFWGGNALRALKQADEMKAK